MDTGPLAGPKAGAGVAVWCEAGEALPPLGHKGSVRVRKGRSGLLAEQVARVDYRHGLGLTSSGRAVALQAHSRFGPGATRAMCNARHGGHGPGRAGDTEGNTGTRSAIAGRLARSGT